MEKTYQPLPRTKMPQIKIALVVFGILLLYCAYVIFLFRRGKADPWELIGYIPTALFLFLVALCLLTRCKSSCIKLIITEQYIELFEVNTRTKIFFNNIAGIVIVKTSDDRPECFIVMTKNGKEISFGGFKDMNEIEYQLKKYVDPGASIETEILPAGA